MRRWVLAAAVFLMLLPAAVAQYPTAPSLELRAEPFSPGLLAPEIELQGVNLTASIGCSTHDSPTMSAVITYKVTETAPFASAVVAPLVDSFQMNPRDCADPNFRVVRHSRATVSITRNAPAFQPFSTKIEFRVAYPDGTTAGPATTQFDLVPDYVAIVAVAPEKYFLKVGPGVSFTFPLAVTNLGNGATTVEFNATTLDSAKLASLIPPNPLSLESRVQKGPEARYKETVAVLGKASAAAVYENSIVSFTFAVNSRSTDPRGHMVDETKMLFSVQIQGGAAPNTPLVATMGVMVLSALAVQAGRRPR